MKAGLAQWRQRLTCRAVCSVPVESSTATPLTCRLPACVPACLAAPLLSAPLPASLCACCPAPLPACHPFCLPLLLQLAWVFNKPVDTVQFADYTQYVSSPMDFGTMVSKVEAKQYNEPAEVGWVQLLLSAAAHRARSGAAA